jgi:hypothetical protein
MAEIESSRYHNEKVNKAETCDIYHPCTASSAYHPKQWDAKYHDLILQNLEPFMILPVAGAAQADAMWFFECISIKHMNGYQPCESWRKTLMFFSQTVPSVRHAAIALALIHRNHLYHGSGNRVHRPQSLQDCLPDKAALLHYNRAIRLLLSQENGDSAESTAITLLVCYLFTCFDHLAGNDVQAMKHLRGGVQLSRNIDKALLDNNNIYDDTRFSGINALIQQVAIQIRRLDMQAVTFLINWTPTDIQETLMSQFLPFDSGFRSLDQAADHLQTLVAGVMGVHYMEQQMSPRWKMSLSPLRLKEIVLGKLEMWSSLFQDMLQSYSTYETNSETFWLISLLHLQYTTAWTYLSSYGPGREMEYDNFLPQFQKCVALASEVAAAHEWYSESSKPTFTPEIGILPVLYIIGVKCRDPAVRREVLSILRRRPIREAVWDSITAARVIERVIEIEENGGEGVMIQSMEHIPVWRRIEMMSWLHVVSGHFVTKMNIKYTFCMREGVHTESLEI